MGGHFGFGWGVVVDGGGCNGGVDVDGKGGVVRGDLRLGWCKWSIDGEKKTVDLGCSGDCLVIALIVWLSRCCLT